VVEPFSITPFGLEVVVVVVVSDDGEGVGVKTGAGGGTVPYSVVVVVSLVAVGPHAVQKPTANAAIDMVTHDFQYCILLILHTINGGTVRAGSGIHRAGTLAPDLRASDRPIAIACLRLFTFLPDFPDLSLPCFISCIARPTLEEAFLLYFRALLFVVIFTNRNRGCLIPCAARTFRNKSAPKSHQPFRFLADKRNHNALVN
jgi:hypothetical protein